MASPGLLAELLEGQRIGAIGAGPLEAHVQHSLGFAAALGEVTQGSSLLDLGSGGGLPGLVLAEALPGVQITLLDGRTARAEHLRAAVARLGWAGRVSVVARRAEEAAHSEMRASFDAVLSRGFGPPAVTAECGAPFLREGGLLVVSEPPGAEASLRWPSEGCALLGLHLDHYLSSPFAFAVLRATSPCGDRYPRRTGKPAKRPLF